MMSSSIPSANPPRADTATSTSKAATAKAAFKADGDGDHDASTKSADSATQVSISAAGLLAAAANKEATETPAQTAQEAQGADMQAKRLLAREQAASKAAQG